jgi:hypothetical protein
MTEPILFLSSTIGLASFVLYLLTTDRFVRTLHEQYREEWNRTGRPVGWFYIPEGESWWPGVISLQKLVCDTLVQTPEWLCAKPDLLFLARRVRWCIALIVLSLLVGFVVQRLPSSS